MRTRLTACQRGSGALGLLLLTGCVTSAGANPAGPSVAVQGPVIEVDGQRFRDANRNGTLEAYEDWRRTPAQRAADLLARMTPEEKAGAMMHGTAPIMGPYGMIGSRYDVPAATQVIQGRHVTSLLTRLSATPAGIAEENNRLQALAAETRLGIPITVSTDPRNHFQFVLGASVAGGGFSQWPEPLGFAALRDPDAVRRFGDRARVEYRAVGIHMALSPQADLATEPRWPRAMGTFGEDPDVAKAMVRAYVEGFQGGSRGPDRGGVAAIVKHWVGYGAAPEGFDAHNYYGRFARLDGAFATHLKPFEGAFQARVAGVMPAYNILTDVDIGGLRLEQVAPGFNRKLLTDLLRGQYRYDGIVISDWAITSDCAQTCRTGDRPSTPADIGMPWGLEEATPRDRFVRGVQAGLDQFGGTERSDLLLEALRAGRVDQARIGASVLRVLRLKFELGLFEEPFVDVAAAARIVGAPEAQHEADRVQARSLVLLENRSGVLPLRPGARVFLDGVDAAAALRAGLVPVPLEAAEVAIVRAPAPSEKLHPNHFFGSRQHEGRLDYQAGDLRFEAIGAAAARAPTVAVITLDRAAVLTAVREQVQGLVVEFGVGDDALLAALTGAITPVGRLPIELPSSMAEVAAQSPGRPHDTTNPLYPIGFGLTLPRR